MKIVKQNHSILNLSSNPLKDIEFAARTCYKSEDKITNDSSERLVKMLQKRGHGAMLEFGDMTVKFVTDRGVTHELVRHRLCSFAQESTRYVNYKEGVQFIQPVWMRDLTDYGTISFDNSKITVLESDWMRSMMDTEEAYISLIEKGWRPEQARSVLPNSLKTEIVVKCNLREWIHIFSLRCSKAAHPQIRELMLPLLEEVTKKVPVLFNKLAEELL